MKAPKQRLPTMGAALVCVLACLSGGPAEAARRLDCSNVHSTASLSTLKVACPSEKETRFTGAGSVSADVLLQEAAELCACALVRHEAVWATMMTHENEVLYLSVEQWLDNLDTRDEHTETKGQNNLYARREAAPDAVDASHPMFTGPDGRRRFLWHRLDSALADPATDPEDVAAGLLRAYSELYFYPYTMRLVYKGQASTQKLRTFVSYACKLAIEHFGNNYVPAFHRLYEMTKNELVMLTMAHYDDNLFRLRMITKTCMYLNSRGQLTVAIDERLSKVPPPVQAGSALHMM